MRFLLGLRILHRTFPDGGRGYRWPRLVGLTWLIRKPTYRCPRCHRRFIAWPQLVERGLVFDVIHCNPSLAQLERDFDDFMKEHHQ